MTKPDIEEARIGTPEAAVQSCVSLIACVTGQPEELTERYLDLYYQVRRAAEDAAERERILRCWDVRAPLTVVPSDGPPRASAPTDATGATEKPAAPAQKKVDFEEVLASASAGKKLPSKPKNAPYGKIKAEIRDRFIALRAQGMTIAQTVNLSGGKVTDGQILNIMNGIKVGMDAYNAIEDAMNKWEATVKSAGQAESTTE